MTSIQTRRERVLAEAVVSAYINELSTPSRERPSRRPARERILAGTSRRGRLRLRPRPVLVQA